jgi:hypothetical protein
MPLHATGVITTLDLVALDASGARDPNAAGAVTLDLGPSGTVIAVSTMANGRAEAQVWFDTPGDVTVTATLAADGRTGTTALRAYTSQLPIWDVAIDPAQYAEIVAMPFAGLKIPAVLTVDGVTYDATVRLHGGTSRDFEKQSFRFDLASGLDIAGHDHFILRAEYADKTILRNWLAFDLLRNVTWLAASESELVHLRINDRFYGVMNHIERIDRDFLRDRGLSTGGSLYEADPLPDRGADLSPLPAADYPSSYAMQAGTAAYADLRYLIEDVLLRPPGYFEATVHDEIDVDEVLVYLALIAVIQNHDHVRKNYYLYRDPLIPRGWIVVPWDLDLTFGHLYTDDNGVLEESIVVDANPFIGSLPPGEHGLYNAMIDRLLNIPELRDRFLALARRIIDTAAQGLTDDRLDWAVCHAMPDLLADERKRADNAEYLDRVDEIRTYLTGRSAFLAGL